VKRKPTAAHLRRLALLDDQIHLVRALRLMSFTPGGAYDHEAYAAIYPLFRRAWDAIEKELNENR